MRWIYRWQQRIAITRNECYVLLGLVFLFSLGLAARYAQSRARPLPGLDYTEVERSFEHASTVLPEATPDPVAAAEGASDATSSTASGAPLNVNTATAATLQRLPGIGPKLAARILAYREAHGPFRRVQDLQQVRGIGKKTLARLTPYLMAEAPQKNVDQDDP